MKALPDLHVITGGPASGKTTLINALAAQGLRHMPEAGRAIIRDQVAIGGTALPWDDRAAFADLMLGWELRSWHEAGQLSGPVLFDRGIPDVIGYRHLCGLPVPEAVLKAAELFRYAPCVFVAPPWRDIFTADAERRQDFAEAEATHAVMVETYVGLGYKSVTLPLAPVDERVRFVRSSIMKRVRSKEAFLTLARTATKLGEHLDGHAIALVIECLERVEQLLNGDLPTETYPALKQTIIDIQGLPLSGIARENAREFLFAYGRLLDAMEANTGRGAQ